VLQVNAYLRQQTSGARGRSFQIYIELLAAPNQIQTRSYGYEYTIVITPSQELRTFDVRHAYLHYLLDPLSTRYQEILQRKQGLADHAQRAHALADSFKDDFLLLVTESLIKAVEARLDHKPEGVQAALREGYILTPYFAEHLPAYEKQEQSMAFYYPDLVGAIDVVKEDKRLTYVEFNKEETVRIVKSAPQAGPVSTPAPLPARPKRWRKRNRLTRPRTWTRPRNYTSRFCSKRTASPCTRRYTMVSRGSRPVSKTPKRRKSYSRKPWNCNPSRR